MSVVVDSSAVLALLLGEPGADAVAELIRDAEMSIVNLCEVMTKTVEAGGDAAEVNEIMLSYGTRIRAFREAHAIEAARLRPLTMHLGLSLGDRACLAQGRLSDLPILTADRRMAEAQVELEIRLIR
jgi:PIN domain nuclease of toxin-antitoxin system